MKKFAMVLGSDIYKAAIAGAREGYNRSTDKFDAYSRMLENCYEDCLADIEDSSVRKNIRRNTYGDWRRASLPLALAMVHHHKFGEPCEPHARVYLTTSPTSVFDIPMSFWNRFISEDSTDWAKEYQESL